MAAMSLKIILKPLNVFKNTLAQNQIFVQLLRLDTELITKG